MVPGSAGEVDPAVAADAAAEIGFPVMIKAAAGGGGRGIRVAQTAADLSTLLPQASAEARSAFGDGRLYLERFVDRARHVEVQVLGDGRSAVHLFETGVLAAAQAPEGVGGGPRRGCLPDRVRQELCASAVRLAEACHYRGAGTLEYLYDDETGEFFFIEMNTRIQVEHPVTEMITGVDLVEEMIRIAAGEPLRLRQGRHRGPRSRDRGADQRRGRWARLRALARHDQWVDHPWRGSGVRFDTMLYPGYTVPPFYDSLLGKLIVWDGQREGRPRTPENGAGRAHGGGCRDNDTDARGPRPPSDGRFRARFIRDGLKNWLETVRLDPRASGEGEKP